MTPARWGRRGASAAVCRRRSMVFTVTTSHAACRAPTQVGLQITSVGDAFLMIDNAI
jgi:hypothetical protein